jgi:hypothetical protein
MRGLDPRIHPEKRILRNAMDCRVKPGNDADSFGTAPAMPLT